MRHWICRWEIRGISHGEVAQKELGHGWWGSGFNYNENVINLKSNHMISNIRNGLIKVEVLNLYQGLVH